MKKMYRISFHWNLPANNAIKGEVKIEEGETTTTLKSLGFFTVKVGPNTYEITGVDDATTLPARAFERLSEQIQETARAYYNGVFQKEKMTIWNLPEE